MEIKTMREFFTAVIGINDVDADVAAFAESEIAKIDKANAKRKEKAAEKRAANTVYLDMLVSFLDSNPQTATDLKGKFENAGIVEIDGKAVTVQKVSSLARKAVAAELAAVHDVKVAGKGTQKGYVAC